MLSKDTHSVNDSPNNLEGCPTNNNLFRHCVILLFLLDEDLSQDSRIQAADSELPLLPRLSSQPQQSEVTPSQEDDVDVDKLPRASANKKRKGKMPLDDQQIL